MSNFASDLQQFAKKTRITMTKIVKKVAIDMTAEIVQKTPVDTGHARSNWFLGKALTGAIDTKDSKNGSPSIARAASFAQNVVFGDVFYIHNNVHYVWNLEYGSSRQAPQGMARITVDRWQEMVNRIVGAL